jgi:hypothetical protein
VIDAGRAARQIGAHFTGKDTVAQALRVEDVALAAGKADGQLMTLGASATRILADVLHIVLLVYMANNMKDTRYTAISDFLRRRFNG